MKKVIYGLLFLFLVTFVTAQYSNPNLPSIQPPEVQVDSFNNNTLNVNNSNCWQGFCNPQVFNDTALINYTNLAYLNNTQTFTKPQTFNNITSTDTVRITTTGFNRLMVMDFLGFEIFEFTLQLGTIVLRSLNNQPFTLCNDDCTAQMTLQDNGYGFFRGAQGFWIDNGFQKYTEFNQSKNSLNSNEFTFNGTYIYGNNTREIDYPNANVQLGRNTTSGGTFHNWSVANSNFFCNGCNITSEKQSYNLTASLDTNYVNNFGRAIMVNFGIFSHVEKGGDSAYVTPYVNGKVWPRAGHSSAPNILDFDPLEGYFTLSIIVQPSQPYSFNKTEGGNGQVLADTMWVTAL